jgi:hypothetical protein
MMELNDDAVVILVVKHQLSVRRQCPVHIGTTIDAGTEQLHPPQGRAIYGRFSISSGNLYVSATVT